jgi:hypothetical protein
MVEGGTLEAERGNAEENGTLPGPIEGDGSALSLRLADNRMLTVRCALARHQLLGT